MHRLRRAILLTTSAIMFFGLAGFSPAGNDANDRMQRHEASLPHDAVVPAPIVGDHLFASARDACWTVEDVLQSFALDIENVGGQIIILTDGIQQDLSDSWRTIVDAGRVEVSLVLAHVVPDPGSEPIVDVVEIDGKGCALSRTLLKAADWLALIEFSQGVEV